VVPISLLVSFASFAVDFDLRSHPDKNKSLTAKFAKKVRKGRKVSIAFPTLICGPNQSAIRPRLP